MNDEIKKDEMMADNKMEAIQVDRLDMVSGGESTGSFVCSKCGEVCANAADFAEHMKKIHYNPYVCPVCGQVFGTGTAISLHMGKYHPKKV